MLFAHKKRNYGKLFVPLLLLPAAELLENSTITEMMGTQVPPLNPWYRSAGC